MTGGILHDEALVVDVHTHGTALLPQPARGLYRLVNRLTMPPDVGFVELAAAGVDAVVAKAVGDPIVTRWHRGGAWAAVLVQLERLRADARRAGARVLSSAAEVRAARDEGRTAVILGLEGADAIGDDLGRLDHLRQLGVRVVVPVHLGDNQLGTTCLPWQRYVGPLPARPRAGDRGPAHRRLLGARGSGRVGRDLPACPGGGRVRLIRAATWPREDRCRARPTARRVRQSRPAGRTPPPGGGRSPREACRRGTTRGR